MVARLRDIVVSLSLICFGNEFFLLRKHKPFGLNIFLIIKAHKRFLAECKEAIKIKITTINTRFK